MEPFKRIYNGMLNAYATVTDKYVIDAVFVSSEAIPTALEKQFLVLEDNQESFSPDPKDATLFDFPMAALIVNRLKKTTKNPRIQFSMVSKSTIDFVEKITS